MDETTNTIAETSTEATTEATTGTLSVTDSAAEPKANTESEIEKLQKHLAAKEKQLAETNKQLAETAKERDGYKRDLRKTKSAEEQLSEEQQEEMKQMREQLISLEKQAAIASNSKKVFSFVGNEDIANTVAEYLMGAADVDGAIDEIAKAWKAKEAQLRKELGKTPIGDTSEEEIKRNKAVDYAKEIGKTKMNNMNSGNNPLSRFII